MAITLHGTDPSIDEMKWAEMNQLAGDGHGNEVVKEGQFSTSWASPGVVEVRPGAAYACGVLVKSDAAQRVTIAPLTGTAQRIDYIVIQIDWSQTGTAGGSILVVQGTPATSPTAPILNRNPGLLWQIPLARVRVRATADQHFLEPCSPRPRRPYLYRTSVASTNASPSFGLVTVATLSIPDPGWPYQVQVSASVRFTQLTQGYGRIYVHDHGGRMVGSGLTGYGMSDPAMISPIMTQRFEGEGATLRLGVTAMSTTATVTVIPDDTSVLHGTVFPS